MLIALLVSIAARIIMPHDVVLINQKLEGYWLITTDNKLPNDHGLIRIIKFDKCKKDERKAHACEFSWSYLDSTVVIKNKLDKSIKQNWEPDGQGIFWVERKRDKETKRAIIHFEDYTNISVNVIKKELNVYLDTMLTQQARKLK